jgi:hypothetical protein
LNGTLVVDINFRLDTRQAYNFTIVSAAEGQCGAAAGTPARRQTGGPLSSFQMVKINFNQNRDCPPDYGSATSSNSYAVLIKPSSSGCGGDDNTLLTALIAGTPPLHCRFVVLSASSKICAVAGQVWWAERWCWWWLALWPAWLRRGSGCAGGGGPWPASTIGSVIMR